MPPKRRALPMRLTEAEHALVARAVELTGATPRALLLTATNAAIQDAGASMVQRAAEQRDNRDLAGALEQLRAAARRTGGKTVGSEAARLLLEELEAGRQGRLGCEG